MYMYVCVGGGGGGGYTKKDGAPACVDISLVPSVGGLGTRL